MSERFSRRTDWPAAPNRISELTERFRRDGTDCIDLTDSNPTRCGLGLGCGPDGKADAAGLLDALRDPAGLSYHPDPKGLLHAREAVSAYYADKGVRVEPDRILLTSGTSEAYHLVLRLLTSPGQAVLTPAPSYPLIDLLLDLNDIRQDRYRLTRSPVGHRRDASSEDRCPWSFSASEARSSRKAGTPALIAIHPNNPTGHAFDAAERGALIEFIRMEKMALIVDEVFLDYSANPSSTFAAEDRVLTFTLSGVSKVLGLPQMKLSWIVVSGPEAERREALRRLEIMADVFLSVNTPVQNALPGWMRMTGAVRDRILERVRTNRRALESELRTARSVGLVPGEGAWTAVLDLPDGSDDEEVAHRLLESAKVLTHPGYLFDFPSGSHLVISLLPPPDRFAEGVRRIARILELAAKSAPSAP